MMKFKYLKGRMVFIEELEEECEEIDCPLPYKNLPDGEYLIRGNQKEHRKEYLNIGGRWFLTDESIKDNGHRICDIAIYETFPNLSEKEWNQVGKVGFNKLKKQWIDFYYGYVTWNSFRASRRNARKARYQILGK